MSETPLCAELLLDREVPQDLQQELVTALTALGVSAGRVRRTLEHRGPSELQWLVLVSLPLQAFLTGLGAEAVKDCYPAFKDVVRRMLRRPEPQARPLVLQDQRSGLRIVLEPDLPGEAYDQLLGLDLAGFRSGPLHYDRRQGLWRSELDEAAG